MSRRAAAAAVLDPEVLERAVRAAGRTGDEHDAAEVAGVLDRARASGADVPAPRLEQALVTLDLARAKAAGPQVWMTAHDAAWLRPGGPRALIEHLFRDEEWEALAEATAEATTRGVRDLDRPALAKAALRLRRAVTSPRPPASAARSRGSATRRRASSACWWSATTRSPCCGTAGPSRPPRPPHRARSRSRPVCPRSVPPPAQWGLRHPFARDPHGTPRSGLGHGSRHQARIPL